MSSGRINCEHAFHFVRQSAVPAKFCRNLNYPYFTFGFISSTILELGDHASYFHCSRSSVSIHCGHRPLSHHALAPSTSERERTHTIKREMAAKHLCPSRKRMFVLLHIFIAFRYNCIWIVGNVTNSALSQWKKGKQEPKPPFFPPSLDMKAPHAPGQRCTTQYTSTIFLRTEQ